MIDASWAMASRGEGRFDPCVHGRRDPALLSGVGAGTVVGVFAGDLISDPEALGLDALFPAFFLALLLGGELRGGRTAIAVALLGAAVALALSPFAPPGVPVICACVAALLGLPGRKAR